MSFVCKPLSLSLSSSTDCLSGHTSISSFSFSLSLSHTTPKNMLIMSGCTSAFVFFFLRFFLLLLLFLLLLFLLLLPSLCSLSMVRKRPYRYFACACYKTNAPGKKAPPPSLPPLLAKRLSLPPSLPPSLQTHYTVPLPSPPPPPPSSSCCSCCCCCCCCCCSCW